MASRHRRRRRSGANQQNTNHGRMAEVTYTEVPVSPEFARPGLDPDVIRALQATDDLVRDMRRDLPWPNQVWDEDSAVKRYLVYTSVLVDTVLADIGMSALIKNDIMVQSKMRVLAEYAVKGAYYDDHPEYALYMTTIGEAKDVLHKLKDAKKDAASISIAEANVEAMKQRFPHVAHLRRLDIAELMTTYADRADYVWLYRAPSAVLHGDPEGMRLIFERLPDGREKVLLEFELHYVNALLVDAGSNALFFCDHFVSRFHPHDEALKARGAALHERYQRLTLKHPYGRDDDAIAEVESQLSGTA
jgi:hypothetical protein